MDGGQKHFPLSSVICAPVIYTVFPVIDIYIQLLLLLLLLLPLLLLLRLFTLPQSRSYTPGTYNPNARGAGACRESNSLWTRTLNRYTRAGLPECEVSTMSGPTPETTQSRTHTKDTRLIQEQIKIPGPAGNRTRAALMEGRDSTDHATATNYVQLHCLTL